MFLPNNANKLLNSKRERETPKFQINENKNKNKKIQILKPKPIKKHSIDKNITESLSSENEENMEESIQEGRQENSLCQLTKNFIKYIKNQGKVNININEIVEKLTVKKRRIYDITNVLQGIGYIQKTGKNEILWTKGDLNKKKNYLEDNYIFQKLKEFNNLGKNIEDLQKQNHDLTLTIEKFREEFDLISKKKDFEKYGYITFEDMSDISIKEKLDILILKSTKGSVITVIDKDDSKKACISIKKQMDEGKMEKNEKLLNYLRNEHHMFLESMDELKIYRVTNGTVNEIIKNHQQKLKYSEDLINNNINNNSLISDSNDASKININRGGCFNLFNPVQNENIGLNRNENCNNNSAFNRSFKYGDMFDRKIDNSKNNKNYFYGTNNIGFNNIKNNNDNNNIGISTIFQQK